MKKFDLHLHTRLISDDASLDPRVAARRLQEAGYAGFAVTDHNAFWTSQQLQALQAETSLIVVRGAEVQTEIGHVLVYGWGEEPLWPYHRLRDLVQVAHRQGAAVVVAHPFRRWFSKRAVGARVGAPDDEAIARLPYWKWVDAIEVQNGKSLQDENQHAFQLAQRLGLAMTAGSDAHEAEQLGTAATFLPDAVHTSQEVIDLLRNRETTVLYA